LRIDSDQEALLDRGGHPTLREFLKHLVFSPASGSIHLSHERLVLQRASQMSHLRDQLIERCGREEAFIQLTRLGFVAGVEDADFIRSSWLGLDPGDVFTAGTRLHMLRGCVHLKTVHNDFDLRKGKFSGEFLWSGSAEAAEFRRNHGPSEAVCWSHVGYASGYATRCFGKLIVYKEVECLGMGHEHCRVVGKPAEGWGEHDEIVQIYRPDIWPAELAASVRPSARTSRMEDDDAVTELLLAPVSNQLGHIARFDVPLLITGERGTGKRTAARAWHEARPGASGGLDFVPCDTLDGDSLDALFGPTIRPRRERGADRERKTIVLTDVDLLAPSVQRRLARRLEDRGARVAATTCQTTDELRAWTNFDAEFAGSPRCGAPRLAASTRKASRYSGAGGAIAPASGKTPRRQESDNYRRSATRACRPRSSRQCDRAEQFGHGGPYGRSAWRPDRRRSCPQDRGHCPRCGSSGAVWRRCDHERSAHRVRLRFAHAG
jgi:hypothetical protein